MADKNKMDDEMNHDQGQSSQSQNQGKGKSNRGFASMDEEQRREIARKGGQSQGKENNPGNFANDPGRASEAGRSGGRASGGQD